MSKKLMSLLSVSVLFLCMCFSSSTVEAATITTYENTPGAFQSNIFTVEAESESIFVENFQAIDYVRFAASSGSFPLEITASENISTYTISPTTNNVTTGTVDGAMLTITIPSVPFHCVVTINDLHKLVIFADPPENNPPQHSDSNVVDVMDFVTDNTGATDQHYNIMQAINYVCSTSGKDTLYFPNGTYLTTSLAITGKSNLNIYLQDGVLVTRVVPGNSPTFDFSDCSECKLFGRGVIDSKGLEGNRCAGIKFQNCSNMRAEDIINRNAGGWQFINSYVSDSIYYNIKDVCTKDGVSGGTDGFSIHNSQDITADYIFAMGNDDSLIISSDDPNVACENITVTHFSGYACRANGIAMGYTPAPGSYVKNITVQDSDFRLGREVNTGYYQCPIKIETGPEYYENIRFKNVSFENNPDYENDPDDLDYITTRGAPYCIDLDHDGCEYDNEAEYHNGSEYTYIHVKGDLEFTDCTFENDTTAHIFGDTVNQINNLIVHNLKLCGVTRTSLSDANMTLSNVKTIDFPIQSDDFNRSTLDPAWSWVREDNTKWSLTDDGYMRITSDGGDLYQTVNNTKNVLVRPAPIGDWSILTKVTVDPSSNYSQAGLIVYKNDNNYIKLVRCYGSDLGGAGLNYAKEILGTYSGAGFTACSNTTVFFKITKSGTTYTLYYNTDGGTTWTQVKQYTGIDFGTSFKVGLLCQSTAIAADFDWFKIEESHTDEFNTSTLDPAWSWVREDNTNWSLTENSGYMRITSDGGDLYQTVNNAKNVLVRTAPSGNWSIYTKVMVDPEFNYSQAGLIVYKDDDNYIKLVRCYGNDLGGNGLNYAKEISATYSDAGFTACSKTIVYFKITKSGNNYTLYYNTDGSTTWTQVKQYAGINFSSSFKVGLLCQSTEINANFDWFDIDTQ